MIATVTDRVVDLLAPEVSTICARDVARGIATKYRYAGHLPGGLLTVAEHSIIVSFCVPERHACRALIHDGSEGYTCDMPSPIRNHPALAAFVEIDERLQRCIYQAFGVDPDDAEGAAAVAEADLRIRGDEISQLGGRVLRARARAAKLVGYGHTMLCLEPLDAERAWLNRFREIFPRRCWS